MVAREGESCDNQLDGTVVPSMNLRCGEIKADEILYVCHLRIRL